MVLGTEVEVTDAPEALIEWAARMHTNKLVFANDHIHFFDVLDSGNILAIPVYESLEKVGEWTYQTPYEMLIVCESSETYFNLHFSFDEVHLENASRNDVDHARTVLSEATMMLADSLVTNWDSHYAKYAGESRFKMMNKMRERLLLEDKVFVPTDQLGDSEEPRLFKVKFGDLFKGEEERKYIPDPLLLLIKSAVNLSAHNYSTCKLLPACSVVSSEDYLQSHEGSREIETAFEVSYLQSHEGSREIETTFDEIRIVGDDEDDAVSVASDITY
jgi:hypothetical protein